MATPGVPDRVTGSCTAMVAGHLGELCELALGHASGTRLKVHIVVALLLMISQAN